ncbi:MAG TPA: inositol monophosphatase family protein [bacterium]|nr:hypothetical protein [Candidatus Omnitrophota bacterium]HOL93227.1 inositol monophosphatase family protein [bacterium]HXK93992.1 inositol monophosphatase family protein [bacterium]
MNSYAVKDFLCDMGLRVCLHVRQAFQFQSVEERAAVHSESSDDTIYQIDRDVEDIIVPLLEEKARSFGGIVLIAEGMDETNRLVLPRGMKEPQAAYRIILDPIDGTRGIMYDKRSAFFLAGAAPNRGETATLQDIEIAVMVELPTSRSHLSDTLWAVKGQGAHRFTRDLLSNRLFPQPVRPSQSHTILGGFAQISQFFPPGREILAQIEEELIQTLFPNAPEGRAILFQDQYISTGGQLYEILVGHDRFVADLRAGLYRRLRAEGRRVGLACHPYDCCAHLIGTESGVRITGSGGGPFNAPMDTTSPVDWIAYANPFIQAEVEPVLLNLLRKYQLISA